VGGSARVGGSAWVGDSAHTLTLGSVGSGYSITLQRNKEGHQLNVGCWTGQIDELMARVKVQSENWNCDQETTKQRIAEYKAILPLLNLRVKSWK
jgi:hypothetical protein